MHLGICTVPKQLPGVSQICTVLMKLGKGGMKQNKGGRGIMFFLFDREQAIYLCVHIHHY